MNTYLDSGVSINSGEKLIERIKPLARSTHRAGVMGDIGGFGALFDLSEFKGKYSSPILVSSTDGVGTKLMVAQDSGKHDSIGIDLVAMCVNDLLAQGAEPLFFLDYFASSKLSQPVALEVVRGITEGCKLANVALIGGETAEMPGMYPGSRYDLAGFAVGITDRSAVLPRVDSIHPGNIVLGLPSHGLHSNGFSLVRKVLHDRSISYTDPCPLGGGTWADMLLKPTKIYVQSMLPVLHLVQAVAHITGGGFVHNIPRILPDHLAAKIYLESWDKPEIFKWLETEAQVHPQEMLRVFNCGIGLVLVVQEDNVDALKEALSEMGESVYIIGEIVARESEHIFFHTFQSQ